MINQNGSDSIFNTYFLNSSEDPIHPLRQRIIDYPISGQVMYGHFIQFKA